MDTNKASLWLRFCSAVTRPLHVDGIGLFLFFILFSGTQIVERSYGSLSYGIYMAIFAFLQFYLFFWVISFSPRIYRIIKPVLAVFLFLYFSFYLFCYIRFGLSISPDFLPILLATNLDETIGFFRMYIRGSYYYTFAGLLLGVISVYYISNKYIFKLSSFGKQVITIILVIFSIAIARNNRVMSVYWEGMWSFDFAHAIDLSLYYSDPQLEYDENRLSDKIVVIIGESFTPTHSSLYGYPICTNPELSRLQQDSLLFVFSQAHSPSTHTIQSFKYILNTFLLSDGDNKHWYESLTLVELLQCLHYHTSWISNQFESGFHDCLSSDYARICDYSQFTDRISRQGYDSELITLDVPNEQRQAIFYHLMGQHGAFDQRYPESFNVFEDAQYLSFPTQQIESRRTYDNATLFNDYVCSSLFQKYQEDDVLGFYFPDHGQDFYDVDEDFCGHGRPGNLASVEAARRIPFMVYVSPVFRQRHPEIVDEIRNIQDEPLCTDSFIYLVMNILNIKVVNES